MAIGMESWFYNFTQLSRRGNSPKTLADIPRPFFEYALWGMFKGAELASLIGGCIAHPLYRIYLTKTLRPEKTTPNSHKVIRNACRRLQGRFLLAGMAIGPAAAVYHSMSLSLGELQERCYKIRCERDSLTIDRCALLCGLIGWYWKRFQGAVDGANIGIAYALLNNKFIEKNTSPMLTDKVKPEERYNTVEEAENTKTELARFLRNLDKTEKDNKE